MTSGQAIPGVLVLYPLKFAGATSGVIVDPAPPAGTPVEGLPQSSFKEVIRRDGSREGAVQAIVDPPTGGSYLNIALYVKGPRDTQRQLLERKPVPTADQDKQTSFNVFQSSLNDGVHVFTYDVERVSGNASTSTESWALYYRDLPGGNDVPGSGAHPDLTLSLPAELGDPPQIGKDEVDKGVPMTLSYPFMKAYDLITLELSRERFTYTVQPGQEGRPYVITVTRAMFEQAGSNVRFPIAYTVVDQVNNPTDKRRWSRTIEANVDTERATLVAPDLSEDPDDPADDPDTIDLGKLKDFLYVQVHVFEPLWAKDDEIRVSYTCTPPSGLAVTHSAEATVVRLPFTYKLQVPAAKVLAGGNVSVTYEQVRGGKVFGVSRAAEAWVIGQGVPDVQLKFLNEPFVAAVAGRLKDIRLSLTRSGNPVVGVIAVTLPDGTTFADGAGGTRELTTQTDGTLTVSGVKAAITPGAYSLTAAFGNAIATAELTINQYGPLGPIAMPPTIRGITLSSDGNFAYVNGTGALHVIDTASSRLLTPTTLPTGSGEIVLDLSGSRAFACCYDGNVAVIDTAGSAVIARIPAAGYPAGIVLSKDGSKAFVSTWTGNTVVVIDTLNLEAIKTITVGRSPRGMDISPDGRLVYVANYESQTVSVIDAQTLEGVRTVQVNMGIHDVAISPDGNSLYVGGGLPNQGTVVQLDTRDWSRIRSISFPQYVSGLAVNHAGTRAYVCGWGNRISTVDTATGIVIDTPMVGTGPVAVAISNDNARAFVLCPSGNTVSVISLAEGAGLGAQSFNEPGGEDIIPLPW